MAEQIGQIIGGLEKAETPVPASGVLDNGEEVQWGNDMALLKLSGQKGSAQGTILSFTYRKKTTRGRVASLDREGVSQWGNHVRGWKDTVDQEATLRSRQAQLERTGEERPGEKNRNMEYDPKTGQYSLPSAGSTTAPAQAGKSSGQSAISVKVQQASPPSASEDPTEYALTQFHLALEQVNALSEWQSKLDRWTKVLNALGVDPYQERETGTESVKSQPDSIVAQPSTAQKTRKPRSDKGTKRGVRRNQSAESSSDKEQTQGE